MSRRRTGLVLFLFAACSANATDFTATRFDDPLPDGCAPTDCSLREAVIAAQAAPDADRVLLPAGTFQLDYDEDLEMAANNTGPLLLDTPIEIIGAGRTATTITAAANLPLVIGVSLAGPAATVVLSDLTIADVAPVTSPFGPVFVSELGTLTVRRIGMRGNTGPVAGILAGGRLTVLDSVFEQNTATSISSGAVVLAARGPLTVSGTQFIENTTLNGALVVKDFLGLPLGEMQLRNNVFRGNLSSELGAGLTVLVAAGLNRVDLSDSVFEDNHSAADAGAAFLGYVNGAAGTTRLVVVADGTRFSGNRADAGCGAMRLDAPTSLGLIVRPTLDIDLARFDDNEAVGDGGALCSFGDTTLARTTFANNTSGGRGGAIVHNDGTLLINQSTLSGNSATSFGGAIAAFDPVEIRRSTLDGNSTDAIGGGGGLYVAGGGASLLRNVTLFGNRADNLANALRVLSIGEVTTLRLDNSILQGGCTTNTSAALLDSQQNIESPGDTCALGALNNSRNVTPANLALGALTDNGGPTRTRMPQAGSVALNRIIVVPSCTQIDQRGYIGTGGNCDIGSVEAGATVPVPLPPEIFANGFE